MCTKGYCSETRKKRVVSLGKVDDLENRSRKNNLILYGIDEDPSETPEELVEKIKTNIFEEKLKISVSSIERCHRLGKKNEKARPVIIKLLDYRDKVEILKSCPKLKGTPFSVSEDFSKKVREIRKKLWQSSAEEREAGSKVKMIFDKLSIDKKIYRWDEKKGKRYKVSGNSE